MVLLLSFVFLAGLLFTFLLNSLSVFPGWFSRALSGMGQPNLAGILALLATLIVYGLWIALALRGRRLFRAKMPDHSYVLERALAIRVSGWLDGALVVALIFWIALGLFAGLANSGAILATSLILIAGLAFDRTRPGLAPAVRFLVADPEPDGVALSWQRPANFQGTVIIRRCNDALDSPLPVFGGLEIYNGTDTRFVDEAVTLGGEYAYWAFAHDQQDRYSAGVATYAQMPSPPPTVENFTATADHGRILLAWKMPPSPFISGVRIVRRSDGCPASPDDGVVEFEGIAESCVDATIQAAQAEYYYAAFTFDHHHDWRLYGPGLCVRVIPLGDVVGGPDPEAIPEHYREEAAVRSDCPVCFQPVYQTDVESGTAVLCPLHTYVHLSCWNALGGCPVVGCPYGPPESDL